MVGRQRKFLRCRCSKTASALILSLFLRVKILHLAHHKFTFLLFRSNYSCLFSHFNDVALAIIAETSAAGRHRALNSTGQTNPCVLMLGKTAVGSSLKKEVACNILFSSI